MQAVSYTHLDVYKRQPDMMYNLTKQVDVPEADTVFVSCTGLGIMDAVPMMEQDFGKTVICLLYTSRCV